MLLSVFYQLDGAQAVSSGVLRGIGKFSHATVVAIIAYYAISAPMAYLFAFKL